MKYLRFCKITLSSDLTKSANQFEFGRKFTLITGDDNSVGKSTLCKMLFWTLGCEPVFDEAWRALNCKAILEFEVDSKKFKVARIGNFMFLSDGNAPFKFFHKITGDYSKEIAAILGFHALLPSRNGVNLECPPPAFYFLPFYIDQRKSWHHVWDSFSNLEQYSSWQDDIISYHTGYLTRSIFQLRLDSLSLKNQHTTLSAEKKKISDALNVLESTIFIHPESPPNTNTYDIIKNIEDNLFLLQQEKFNCFEKLSAKNITYHELKSQKKILVNVINELEEDYKFSVENIAGEEISCPLCGTTHDNSVVFRSSFLVEKAEATQQLTDVKNEIVHTKDDITYIKNKIRDIEIKINEIQQQFKSDDVLGDNSLHSLLSKNFIGNRFSEIIAKKTTECDMALDKLKKSKKFIQAEKIKLTPNI